MAAPDYVPVHPTQRARRYTSPPRRPEPWFADRPGELTKPGMPRTGRVGTIGPDSGFAFRLARSVFDRLHLGAVDRDDAAAGAVGVGMKRAALFARGPVIHDINVGFTVFGFFDENPDPELVTWREHAFAQIASPHHYFERQEVIDRVPDSVLLAPHTAIISTYQSDWRRNLTR